MTSRSSIAAAWALAASTAFAQPDLGALDREVTDTERAFARSMAERDLAAVAGHLSEQAVFFAPPKVLHGKAEVVAAWKPYFEAKSAPFSWEPDQVEVTAAGRTTKAGSWAMPASGRFQGRGYETVLIPRIWR